MRLSEMLVQERVAVVRGSSIDKREALRALARLLAKGCEVPERELERVLEDREELHSTGIGDGVAIPHGYVPIDHRIAALLLVPDGLDFGAIDDAKVHHLFAVVGPKSEAGEHLRTLARISKLMRDKDFRAKLLSADGPESAFELVASHEGSSA